MSNDTTPSLTHKAEFTPIEFDGDGNPVRGERYDMGAAAVNPKGEIIRHVCRRSTDRMPKGSGLLTLTLLRGGSDGIHEKDQDRER